VPRFLPLRSSPKARFESELAEELQFHIENRTLHLIKDGLTAKEAERQARMEFGSLDTAKDECRSTQPFESVFLALRNLTWAFRRAARAPGFAATIVATLAIGIAAVNLSGMLLHGAYLRPLPFVAPQDIGLIWAVEPSGGTTWLSVPEFDELHGNPPGVVSVEAIADEHVQLLIDGRGREIQGIAVSHGFLSLLGLTPLLGRDFTADDDAATSPPTVILSQSLWQSQFGADPGIVGRTIAINERPHTVIGVLPASFMLPPATSVMPDEIEFLRPLAPNLTIHDRTARMLQVFARRHPSASFAEAETRLKAYGQRVVRDFPSAYHNEAWRFQITPFRTFVLNSSKSVLLLLFLLSAVILSTACVNTTSLLLVRGESCRNATSIRAALGATRLRLAGELLAEVMIHVLLASIVSILAIYLVLPALRALTAGSLPDFLWQAPTPIRVIIPLLLTFAIAVLIAIPPIARLATFLQFQEPGRGASRSRITAVWGRRLVAVQIALATTATVSALCLFSRFQELQRVDLGFSTQLTITARLSLTARYADDDTAARFVEATIQRLTATSGVQAAGAITQLPLSGATWGSTILPAGDTDHLSTQRRFDVDLRGITPGYLQAAGTQLIAGRDFAFNDSKQAPGVAIVDETFARQLAPEGNVLGKRIRWIRAPGRELEIVGIVRAVRHRGPNDRTAPTVYRPYAQYPRRSLYLLAHTSRPRDATVTFLRDAVASVDPTQSVADEQSMQQRWSRSTGRQRLSLTVASTLALAGLLLSAAGVYSVLAFDIAQRKREFGIRTAMGADSSSLLTLVLRETTPTILLGVACGLLGAAAVAGGLGQTEFWPTTGVVWAAAFGASGMLLVAFVASWLPARRASTLQPRAALSGD
jgi:putative ABC transport system permease protein